MLPDHHHNLFDAAVLTILNAYSSFSYKPQHSQWTILASFFLTRQGGPSLQSGGDEIKIISLATGTKCLPATKLSPRGETVHDCHAEVLARRSALRWIHEEIIRIRTLDSEGKGYSSQWLTQGPDGKYALHEDVQLNLYVSTLPCGDASMRFLASVQEESMASLKNSSVFPDLDPLAVSRGRDNYARLGALRTKPGRADSPPTLCMSCSDKIARWNVLGIQGALGSKFLAPLYIGAVVIGEVPLEMRKVALEDCERAFWSRLGGIEGLPTSFSVHRPGIHFTNFPFAHSRSVLGSSSSSNEALCWNANSQSFEILINGLKRGVAPKDRYREKSRPRVSRIALLNLYNDVLKAFGDSQLSASDTYLQLKHASIYYQAAQHKLAGQNGPFAGWITSGTKWKEFNINGEVLSLSEPSM
ncbi:hypothetical protein GALMADRAFT_132951 [Galerina marginata CBS 339.88]|uniref:A to I editase domain-containing protein n=1 Tax=Galerina marginata (strain CBS 339.88) TaxID=685588 RepID=A0A067TUD8_GALM3|nr:hypothetical protein GALMADRAFT_132951 [Galerina marginata CBS 339.88]